MILSKRKHIDDDSAAQRGFASVRRVQVNVLCRRDEVFPDCRETCLLRSKFAVIRNLRIVKHDSFKQVTHRFANGLLHQDRSVR